MPNPAMLLGVLSPGRVDGAESDQDAADLAALVRYADGAALALARDGLALVSARGFHRGLDLLGELDASLSGFARRGSG